MLDNQTQRLFGIPVLILLGWTFAGAVQSQGTQAEKPVITERAEELNVSFSEDAREWVSRFERPGREVFDRRMEILDLMELKPGMDVADIGAGSGFFSRLMAQRVAPGGTVYAVDISEPLVEHIARVSKEQGLQNVKAIVGDPKSPKLPENSVDVVFISHSYHHFAYPYEMLSEIKKALRPGGLFLLIDVERIQGVTPEMRWKMVRAGKGTFTDEIINAGFWLEEEVDMFEQDYVLKFRHRDSKAVTGRNDSGHI